MQNKDPLIGRRRLSLLRIVSYAGIAAGAIVLVCVLALLIFSDPFVNKFVKPRITKAFVEALPEYSIRIADMNYSVLRNRFGFDSVAVRAVDGKLSGTVRSFSISGIGWLHLLWGGSLGPNDFTNSVVAAQEIVVNLPRSQYRFRCKELSVSVPNSEMVAESLECHPLSGDEQFFRASAYRRTRISFVTSQWIVKGLAWLDLLEGKSYRAQSAQIHNPVIDVLLNKDKPDSKDTAGPFMPNEILSLIKIPLRLDRLSVTNGQLKYGERFGLDAKPALITFDSMQVSAEGIANRDDRGAVLVVHAQAQFVKAGTMTVQMTIPVATSDFSFQYSGSLSGMDLSPINSFLEISDHMRIKEGVLEAVTYEINVASGRATGNVSGVYRNLTIAAINKTTGSEKGFSDKVTSFIANNFKIRRKNVPGSMKIGKVSYTRQPDDPFFQYAWFSLRTGVRDVLGF
jgi:hypothetical protein